MATYQAAPGRITYLIPFSYGSHSDISVRHVGTNGTERTLEYETDYRIIEHCVVLTPDSAGHGLEGTLLIDSATYPHEALVLEAERVEAARKAGLWESRSAWYAERAARIALDSAAKATDACETARAEIDTLAKTHADNLTAALNKYTQDVQATQQAYMQEAIASIYAACYEAVARANNPGIAAIPSYDNLVNYSAGCFIINPYLKQQTPFMGFYPVQNMEPVTWDGVFVIIPQCPGHKALSSLSPSQYPQWPGSSSGSDSDNDDGSVSSWGSGTSNADGEHWLPCDHVHY